ncbi:hypothetical protein [Algoriphagus sp.]|uniref:hypothetical protein n=1 Tax=Algoriphagus sp. TaxID=1872435 RepID=UPI00391C3F96
MKIQSKRIFASLTLFSFLALMPMSCGLFCGNDSCGCGSLPKPRDLRVKSFETLTVNESGNEILDSEIKAYNQVFKTLRIKEAEYKVQSSIESTSSTLGLAFACDPAPDRTKNSLYLIQILNQKEFTLADGTNFSVGDNITSLFGMNHFFAQGLTSIENFTAPGLRLIREDYFKIGVIENPGKELNLKFTIRLLFDDRQEFLLTDQLLNVR